ncbi:DUF5994 family protein [Streptomyces sp. NPDC060194]|uniref:DUF5994 family protein n=1 Tax=Streptomyces sp. NPDC060194 TaxID=3347069 RepID=UPI0036593FAC
MSMPTSEHPHPARLRLAPSTDGPHRIDGAWWPDTDDLVAELPRLLDALPPGWERITHITVDASTWKPFPDRLRHAGHDVELHVNSTRHGDAAVCLVSPGTGRLDLLVVPSDTEEPRARHLMHGSTEV